MNLVRFRIALGHSDQNVIISGLQDFTTKVLTDHDAILSFGYCGRNSNESLPILERLHPVIPEITVDLLQLIKTSPQIEEIFNIWNIPDHQDDKNLCSYLMNCISAILHCSQSNESFCRVIINRILTDYNKSLYLQISSGHLELVHATIGLLISMSRISKQSARDVFQRFNFQASQVTAQLQRGKKINWDIPSQTSIGTTTETITEEKLSTDSRYLFILLVLLILEAATDDMLLDLFSRDSILKKLISSITKDTKISIKLLLDGIRDIQRDAYYLTISIKNVLMDDFFQNKLFDLLKSNDIIIQSAAKVFLIDFMNKLVKNLHFRKGNTNNSRLIALKLVKRLEGHKDLEQREVSSLTHSLNTHTIIHSFI